jgi:SAM-dependent methyltransferase
MAEETYGLARRGLRTRVADPLSRRARARRWALIQRLIEPRPGARVVDVGCGDLGLAAFTPQLAITGVDREPRPSYEAAGRRFVQADATDLPFADGEFELAYSNSLIEHIVDPADRARAAGEIRRVGVRYLVQTPNRWFPVEPHSLLPLVHLLPRRLGRRLWRLGVSDDPFEQTRLLRAAELRRLFPDAVIVRERFGPLTKSLIAAGPAELVRGGATRRRGPGRPRGSS